MRNYTTDFDAFFSAATVLSGSYSYQRELATDASLPELLSVPTGVGKTAPISRSTTMAS